MKDLTNFNLLQKFPRNFQSTQWRRYRQSKLENVLNFNAEIIAVYGSCLEKN